VTPLSRATPAPPVGMVHLGLGSFFRAHQAWYTDRAADAGEWGIAAYSGRRDDLAAALTAQDGLYTLVTRAADGDRFGVVGSVARAHAAAEHERWLADLRSPGVRVLTTTVTEAGYRRDATGSLDLADPEVAADVAALRHDPSAAVRTAPARIVAGLLARRRADAGPIALVPCDNLPENGRVLATVLGGTADAVDPSLRTWMAGQVAVLTSMVDRITPEPTDAERQAVLAATGVQDRCPVATEPFSEWVLAGSFPGGRPAWETAGAVLTDDIAPFEERKLWLLNGGHTLLAYAGPLRGATTVDEAVADPVCRGWLDAWWNTCTPHLRQGAEEIAAYRAALLERFANPRMRHALAQIASDGSQKLPVRILPVLGRQRAAGRLPEPAITVLAAWVLHLQGHGVPVRDVRAEELRPLADGPAADAVPRLLAALDPALADDGELVGAVRGRVEDLRPAQ
jgi:fructuronate reductase